MIGCLSWRSVVWHSYNRRRNAASVGISYLHLTVLYTASSACVEKFLWRRNLSGEAGGKTHLRRKYIILPLCRIMLVVVVVFPGAVLGGLKNGKKNGKKRPKTKLHVAFFLRTTPVHGRDNHGPVVDSKRTRYRAPRCTPRFYLIIMKYNRPLVNLLSPPFCPQGWVHLWGQPWRAPPTSSGERTGCARRLEAVCDSRGWWRRRPWRG